MSSIPIEVLIGVISALTVALLVVLWKQFVRAAAWISGNRGMVKRLRDVGISSIYGSRADYARFRGAPRLIDYLGLAKERIVVAGFWLAQGSEMEGVVDGLEGLLRQREKLQIQIVIIDPTASYVESVATNMGMSKGAVRARAVETLRRLNDLQQRLPESDQNRIRVATYLSQPVLSLIALDPDRETGRMQVDIKPYGVPRSHSISFECRGVNTIIYQTLIESCQRVLEDAVPFGLEQLACLEEGAQSTDGDGNSSVGPKRSRS